MSTKQQAHIEYLQRLADNSLILGQRVAEWCGHSPVLEEDMALTNISLDLIGQARLLLQHVAKLEGKGRTEDQLAFLRMLARCLEIFYSRHFRLFCLRN